MSIDIEIPRWWSHAQRERLTELQAQGAWIGYWNSDERGLPTNGGQLIDTQRAHVGQVLSSEGPLSDDCGEGQLHATREPLQWSGSRVWLVALLGGEVREEGDKAWALQREIIGEIMPMDCHGAAAALRASIHPRWDLKGADLRGAYLDGAHLEGEYLEGAYLRGAYLRGSIS